MTDYVRARISYEIASCYTPGRNDYSIYLMVATRKGKKNFPSYLCKIKQINFSKYIKIKCLDVFSYRVYKNIIRVDIFMRTGNFVSMFQKFKIS